VNEPLNGDFFEDAIVWAQSENGAPGARFGVTKRRRHEWFLCTNPAPLQTFEREKFCNGS
jgi:hypothetical protein